MRSRPSATSGPLSLFMHVLLNAFALTCLFCPAFDRYEVYADDLQAMKDARPTLPIWRGVDERERIAKLEERTAPQTAQIAMLNQGYQDISARLIRLETQTDVNARILWGIAAAVGAQILAALFSALGFGVKHKAKE